MSLKNFYHQPIFSSKLKGNIFSVILIMFILSACHQEVENVEQIENIIPTTRMDTISYIMGYDYGVGIAEKEIGANPLLIYKGLHDALNDRQPLLDDTLQNRLIEEFSFELEEIEKQRFEVMLAQNRKKGEKFLLINKEKEGVHSLPSGLQYKILKFGNGPYPMLDDSISIHYRAMYIDRTTFDMTYDEGPVNVKLSHLVKGLTEGIRLMQTGAIFEFYLSPDIAYGNSNYLDLIPAGSTVIYTVELIKIF